MITSRIYGKGRTTLPETVRSALSLQPGDQLSYVINGKLVILSRYISPAASDALAVFSEWHSDADNKSYKDL